MPVPQIDYPAKARYQSEVSRDYLMRRSGSKKWQLEHRAVARLLGNLPAAASVLDAPVGTARFHELFRDLNLKPYGLDVSLAMLEQAARSMPGLIARGDVTNLPLATCSVDYVLSVRFLNWLPAAEREAALAEFRRVARRGLIVGIRTCERTRLFRLPGLLKSVLSRPIDSLGRLTAPLRRRLRGNEPSILIPPKDEILALFDRLDLDIVSSEPIVDGTESTRRFFRYTPLNLFLLGMTEP